MDVFKLAQDGGSVNNGGIMVSVGVLGVTEGHTLSPSVNISQIETQSGVLDTRFDDPRYYSGEMTT